MTLIYVPKDAGALSLGAAEVAAAIAAEARARAAAVTIVRNGSRGAYWLEPLVEVLTPAGRCAYGPVSVADVPSLFAADFLNGGAHALAHGLTDSLPWLAGQQRLTFERVGIVDPTSVADYVKHGGYQGLTQALSLAPAVDAEARPFRPGSNGRPSTISLLCSRSTSRVMPMRATRGPSPTAC
jgi:formate dehydrogenase iron-sulfur subunit